MLSKICHTKLKKKKKENKTQILRKIFAKHIPDKGLVSRIRKVAARSNKKKKDLITQTTKDVWMANQHMRCPSLVTKEMRIKTTLNTTTHSSGEKFFF